MSHWEERREGNRKREGDKRTGYQRDHARLVHSSAFRRLQAKTQVLGLGDSDFYRTRLTHTMEVAQIGTSINKELQDHYKADNDPDGIWSALPSRSLMNSICLAHDIGHPPFGHGGEVALNKCMKDSGGFEGNAQTLRILSKLEKYSDACGLDPTRRTLLGILKYPASYEELVRDSRYPNATQSPSWNFKAANWKAPKCYYGSENDVVRWMFRPLSGNDKEFLTEVEHERTDRAGNLDHSKPIRKSLDASIMEIADDIAYGIHDLEDAISVGIVSSFEWEEYLDKEFPRQDSDHPKRNRDVLNEWLGGERTLDQISNNLFLNGGVQRKEQVGYFVHKLIKAVGIWEPDVGVVEPLVKYNACLDHASEVALNVFRDFVKAKVIDNRNVQLLEFKGQRVITEIFEVLVTDPKRFLPESTWNAYKENGEDRRVICDYIAGMTDEYAARTYDRLFVTGKGSIFEK